MAALLTILWYNMQVLCASYLPIIYKVLHYMYGIWDFTYGLAGYLLHSCPNKLGLVVYLHVGMPMPR